MAKHTPNLLLTSNVLSNGIVQFLNLSTPLIAQVYAIRILALDQIAQIALINSFIYIGLAFAIHQSPAVFHALCMSAEKPDKQQILCDGILCSLIFSVLATIILYGIFLANNYDIMLCSILIIPLLTTPISSEYYYQATLQNKLILLRRLVSRTLFLILLITLVKKDEDVYIYAAISSLTLSAEHIYNFLKLDFRGLFSKFDLKRSLYACLSNLNLLPMQLSTNPIPSFSIIIAGYIYPLSVVGEYSILVRIVNTATTFLTSNTMVFIPFAKLISNADDNKKMKVDRNILIFLLFAGLTISTIIFISSDYILELFLSTYVNKDSAIFLCILSLFIPLHSVTNHISVSTLIGDGRINQATALNIFSFVIFIASLFTLSSLNASMAFPISFVTASLCGFSLAISLSRSVR